MSMEQNFKGKWNFDKFFYFSIYEGKIKEMIRSYKYGGSISLYRYFVDIFDELFDNFPPPDSVITTVPITFNSFKIKGFDHMKKIGRSLSKKRGIQFLDLIEVVRQKKQQVNSTFEERKTLVKGKYGVKIHELYKTDGKIAILDDVFTTGATVNECARVLKEAGARSVYVYAIAKAKSGRGHELK
ncbi:MAG: ComF family protein [Athalassotoga sp.]|uniref:ComF family protein n=1 Tax=Athalassotoga sp. TaxID=2022597 RepID=UPI003D088198